MGIQAIQRLMDSDNLMKQRSGEISQALQVNS